MFKKRCQPEKKVDTLALYERLTTLNCGLFFHGAPNGT